MVGAQYQLCADPAQNEANQSQTRDKRVACSRWLAGREIISVFNQEEQN